MKKLEGAWIVYSATRDGLTLHHLKGGQMVFARGKLTVNPAVGEEEQITYRVNPSQKPKAIDFEPEDRKLVADMGKAIYELDGDTLKLCIGRQDSRPGDFTDKGRPLLVPKRKK